MWLLFVCVFYCESHVGFLFWQTNTNRCLNQIYRLRLKLILLPLPLSQRKVCACVCMFPKAITFPLPTSVAPCTQSQDTLVVGDEMGKDEVLRATYSLLSAERHRDFEAYKSVAHLSLDYARGCGDGLIGFHFLSYRKLCDPGLLTFCKEGGTQLLTGLAFQQFTLNNGGYSQASKRIPSLSLHCFPHIYSVLVYFHNMSIDTNCLCLVLWWICWYYYNCLWWICWWKSYPDIIEVGSVFNHISC